MARTPQAKKARPRKQGQRGKKAPPPPPAPGAALLRIVLTLVAAAVVVLGSAYLFAGTDGFRSMVEARLSSAMGLPLEIGDSRALLNGDLVLTDIHTRSSDGEGTAGVHIDQALVTLRWRDLAGGELTQAVSAIQVDGWRVRFASDEDGRLQPAELAAASDWLGQWGGLALPDADAPSPPQRPHRTGAPEIPIQSTGGNRSLDPWRHTRISLRGGEIEWWDAAGNVMVSVHDIAFHLTPLQLPTRQAAHYHATVKSAVLPGNQRVREMDLELLRTGDIYLVLNLEAVRQTGGTADRAPPAEPDAPAPRVVPAEIEVIPEEVEIAPPVTRHHDMQEFIRKELEEALRTPDP